jgi:hypothetical protein
MRKLISAALASLMLVAYGHASAASGTAQGVQFVSGGVGEDSEAKLKAEQKNFNLKLLLTLNEGNYLADVNVVVTDAKGNKVIEHVAEGPFFLAKLPAGQYTVAATYEGKTQTRRVSVGSGLQTVHLRWPKNAETDFVVLHSGK